MPEAVVVELKPAFRALCAKLREFWSMMSFAVGHLGFDVSMVESSRDGALQFVVLFADATGNDVRMIWTAVGGSEVSLVVRDGRGGKRLGTYRLSDLVGSALRDLIDGAIADAIARVEAFAANRGRSRERQRPA